MTTVLYRAADDLIVDRAGNYFSPDTLRCGGWCGITPEQIPLPFVVAVIEE